MDGTIEEDGLTQRTEDEGRRFAKRMYLPRVFGLGLGAVCIGGALYQQGVHPAVWVALLLNALVWPHIAYPLARRNGNPYRAELRNLMIDSVSGGVWIAVLGFNLVPSAVLVSMLAMDKVSVGGLRFLARCLAAQAAAIVVVAAALAASAGFEVRLTSSVFIVIASLPLLIVYPIMVGLTANQLASRVRRQNVTLAALSSMDGLTGLLNRMHWEKAVTGEFERCRSRGHQSAVMMIDIDHFKSINDTHGHPAGDAVIRCVAKLLRNTLRTHDVPARYGGEEFGVVLPGTEAEGAKAIAERLRHRIESTVLEPKLGIHATISLGIAIFDAAEADHAAWIARADRALYQAKAGGRNFTVISDAAQR